MDLNKYKKQLIEEKEKLTNLIPEMQDNTLFGNTTHHSSERFSSGELSSYDNHIADIGTDVFMQDMQNSLTIHEKGKLGQVESALTKIENGTYGSCDICHKPIDEERLDILPETGLCAHCAKEHDNLPLENQNMDLNFVNKGCNFYSEDLEKLTNLNKIDKR